MPSKATNCGTTNKSNNMIDGGNTEVALGGVFLHDSYNKTRGLKSLLGEEFTLSLFWL